MNAILVYFGKKFLHVQTRKAARKAANVKRYRTTVM